MNYIIYIGIEYKYDWVFVQKEGFIAVVFRCTHQTSFPISICSISYLEMIYLYNRQIIVQKNIIEIRFICLNLDIRMIFQV